jgi:hypothetical protein
MVGGVIAENGSPVAVATIGRRLKIHAPVAWIFRLRCLNARSPFAIAICHPGPNLGKDDFRDFSPWNRSCSVRADRFSKIPAINQWNDLAKNFATLRRLLPSGEARLGVEINNDGPRYL